MLASNILNTSLFSTLNFLNKLKRYPPKRADSLANNVLMVPLLFHQHKRSLTIFIELTH